MTILSPRSLSSRLGALARRRWLALGGLLVLAAALAVTVAAKDGGRFLDVRARDHCDPLTFGAICFLSPEPEVTLAEFNAAIPLGGHEDWKFNPGRSGSEVNSGGTVQVRSDGGIRHTFTRVAAFGGGIVPRLNEAVGNAPVRPECQTEQTEANGNVLVVQGSVQQFRAGSSPLLPRGTNRYQCCIHPWMRTTITVR
jgi:hypothetical protein